MDNFNLRKYLAEGRLLNEAMDGGRLFDYFNKEYIVDDHFHSDDSYIVKREPSGKDQYVIFDYDKDTDQFQIRQLGGYQIDQKEAMKAGMKETSRLARAGMDAYMVDGNYSPTPISIEGLKDIVDHVMGGLSREADIQQSYYARRGPVSGTIDEAFDELDDGFDKNMEDLIKAGSRLNPERFKDVIYYIHNNWMAGNYGDDYAIRRISKYLNALEENVAPNLEENEIGSLGKELADEIEDILDKDDKVNEVVDPVSILATVLAGTTLTNILSKWVGKIFKKYDFGKGEEAAKKIESFTHRLEKDFKSPIKRVMGLFIKNEKALDVTTDALYAAVILTLGVLAGGGAVQALLKGDLNKGALQTLKAALKGKDLNTLIRDIATNIPG